MAGSVNKVILVGNLGRDPEIRSTQDGMRIANLAVATSENWRDKMSGERKERTEWHRVVIFNERLAEVAEKYLKKGAQGLCRGRAADPQMDRQQRPGALHDRGRAAALPRRADDARRRGRRGAGGPPIEGGYDEGGFGDEPRASGATATRPAAAPRSTTSTTTSRSNGPASPFWRRSTSECFSRLEQRGS